MSGQGEPEWKRLVDTYFNPASTLQLKKYCMTHPLEIPDIQEAVFNGHGFTLMRNPWLMSHTIENFSNCYRCPTHSVCEEIIQRAVYC